MSITTDCPPSNVSNSTPTVRLTVHMSFSNVLIIVFETILQTAIHLFFLTFNKGQEICRFTNAMLLKKKWGWWSRTRWNGWCTWTQSWNWSIKRAQEVKFQIRWRIIFEGLLSVNPPRSSITTPTIKYQQHQQHIRTTHNNDGFEELKRRCTKLKNFASSMKKGKKVGLGGADPNKI